MSGVDLSFEGLRPEGNSSLAYWVGVCDFGALEGIDAIGMTRAMSYRYDLECQAERLGGVSPGSVPRGFQPVAPVQLTRAWSPLPTAVQMLGEPDQLSVEAEAYWTPTMAGLCVWAGVRTGVRGLAAGHGDYERFRKLLTLSALRAQDAGRGVLVVAKPGWSYQDGSHTAAS